MKNGTANPSQGASRESSLTTFKVVEQMVRHLGGAFSFFLLYAFLSSAAYSPLFFGVDRPCHSRGEDAADARGSGASQ